MKIQYSKQAIKFLSKQDKPTKIRFQEKQWESIPVEEPDEIDINMIEEMKNDADCKEFVSSEQAMKMLGL